MKYEEALKIARERKPNIDVCDEWEGGWVCGFSGDAKFDGGYGHAPVVITKKDGEIVAMPQFTLSGTAGEFLRSFDIT